MNTQKLTFRSCSERILPSGVSSPRAKSIGFIKGGIERNVTYTAVGSIRVPDPALAQKLDEVRAKGREKVIEADEAIAKQFNV